MVLAKNTLIVRMLRMYEPLDGRMLLSGQYEIGMPLDDLQELNFIELVLLTFGKNDI